MNKTIREKIHGAVFGYAIGDALGLGTEFMTRRTIERKYPDGLTSYSQIIQDAHRSQWARGAVTNDTLILGMLIDTVCESGKPDALDFARHLSRWYLTDPIDVTQVMRWVLVQPDFISAPFEASKRVAQRLMQYESPSDALGRALVTGIWNEHVRENTREVTQVTHHTPRCVGAARVVAAMANSIMWKGTTASFGELKALAEEKAPVLVEYVEKARYGSLEDLALDAPSECLLARKGMGAALWAAWHCETPEEALVKIVNQGGDADTNASLATALVAMKTGFSAIPPKYVDGLDDKFYVQALADKFTAAVIDRFGQTAR